MKTAVYTTFYPTMLKYADEFLYSLAQQSEQDFDLWISLDGLEPKQIKLPNKLKPIYYQNQQAKNPIEIRKLALAEISAKYDAVVLVDSDDILYPNRIKAAKKILEKYDVYACSLDLIAENGKDLGLKFITENQEDWLEFLSNKNVFGFSNTAYRTSILKDIINIPSQTIMMDWLVVLKALVNKNAQLYFDSEIHMAYRQYENNTNKIVSPLSAKNIKQATNLLLKHHLILNDELTWLEPFRGHFAKVKLFAKYIEEEANLAKYLKALNNKKEVFYWYEQIAYQELEYLWN